MESQEELQRVIASIADQLCDTVDNNFDVHVSVDSDDIQGQKLSLLVNFLLENVRRHMGQLEQLNNQLEEKVKERTQLLDLVISGSDDGVWIWSYKEKRLEFSPRWHAMVGELPSEGAQDLNHWLDRVHPRDRAGLRRAVKGLLEGRDTNLTAEYRIRHAAGGYRWMLCRGACQRDDHGTPKLLAGTQTDITYMRSIDQRSGLPNDSYLKERIEDALDKNSDFYLIMVSFNELDSLSEALDHSSIRTLVDDVCNRMVSSVAVSTVIAKISGNTFAVFGQVEDYEDVVAEMKNECQRVIEGFKDPFRIKSYGDHKLSLSIGALETTELAHTGADAIINAAWSALRYSKKSGKTCFYDKAHRETSARRVLIEQKLRDGMRDGCVQPWFQPIYSGHSCELIGFEALARMQCDDIGFVPPDEFIAVAEQGGMMIELGESILRQSILIARSLSEGILKNKPFYVAVNASVIQLLSDNFAKRVSEILNEYKLPPEYLRIEVTESVFVENINKVRNELKALRKRGVKIALDDFGTGYSSLSYLRRLPIDVLKIDRSFITDLDKKESKAAIVATIHSLANLLGLQVVAEGVETREELISLAAIGDMAIQGYHFSKPLPQGELVEYLQK